MRRSLQSALVCLFLFLAFFSFATPASAQMTQEWQGVCTHNSQPDGVATIQGFQCLIGNVLQVAVSGIGLAGFVMLLVGAFKYLLSGGNAKGVDEGQRTMTYAVIGLVVAVSSFFILQLLASFTGVYTILDFTIPNPTTNANTDPGVGGAGGPMLPNPN